MYTITTWSNTGFDSINIPSSPSVLDSMSSVDFPALDLLQNDGLSYVSIRGTWDNVKNIDYIKIGDIYYAVVSAPVMTSYDVARLSILPDYITSSGGISALHYTDGMVERAIFDRDEWGYFPESDSYLAPALPLQLKMGQFVGGGFSSVTTVCESTIDLKALADCFDASGKFTGKGITFNDSVSGQKVTIPYTEGVKNFSLYTSLNRNVLSPGTKLYDSGNASVKKALGALRAIGAESAIVSQTAYPKDLIEVTANSYGEVTAVAAKTLDEKTTGLPFIYDPSIPMCLCYSNYCKYGIMTSSGSKMEAPPLMLAPANGAGSAAVNIRCDPRPDGKPYFRFSEISGDSSDYGFWLGAVDGSRWASVPLIWSEPSGSYQSQISYDLSAASSAAENDFQRQAYILRQGNSMLNAVGSMLTAATDRNFGGMVTAAAQGVVSHYANALSEENRNNQRELQRRKELYDYQISQNIVTPSIQCPFNASMIRDYYGNGAFTYRYQYHPWDSARLTKIIKRFGNKKTQALKQNIIYVGKDGFGYLKARGVQVSDHMPRFWKDGISDQFNAGVRYWDKKPIET